MFPGFSEEDNKSGYSHSSTEIVDDLDLEEKSEDLSLLEESSLSDLMMEEINSIRNSLNSLHELYRKILMKKILKDSKTEWDNCDIIDEISSDRSGKIHISAKHKWLSDSKTKLFTYCFDKLETYLNLILSSI